MLQEKAKGSEDVRCICSKADGYKCVHTREQIETSQQRQQLQQQYQAATQKSCASAINISNSTDSTTLVTTYESHRIHCQNRIQGHNAPVYSRRQQSQIFSNSNVIPSSGQVVAGEASHAWTMRQPASHGPGPVTGVMCVGHPVDLLNEESLSDESPSITQLNKLQPIMDIYLDSLDHSVLPLSLPGQLTPPPIDYTDADLSISQSPLSYQQYHLYPSQYIPAAYSPRIVPSSPPASPSAYYDSYPSPPKTPSFSFTSYLHEDIMLPDLDYSYITTENSMPPLYSMPSTPSAHHSETSSVSDRDPGSPRTEDMSDLEYEILRAEGMNDDEYSPDEVMAMH